MTLLRSVIIALLFATVAISVLADGPGPTTVGSKEKRNPRSQNGSYTVVISGYYKGQGTATVSAASVSITAQVHAEGGPVVSFKSDTLQINGQYFQGVGTAGNVKLQSIKGRLDAASSSRLVATYKTNDNHLGRIAGTLPTDPPNPNWNDDRHGDDGGAGGGGAGGGGGGKD